MLGLLSAYKGLKLSWTYRGYKKNLLSLLSAYKGLKPRGGGKYI